MGFKKVALQWLFLSLGGSLFAEGNPPVATASWKSVCFIFPTLTRQEEANGVVQRLSTALKKCGVLARPLVLTETNLAKADLETTKREAKRICAVGENPVGVSPGVVVALSTKKIIADFGMGWNTTVDTIEAGECKTVSPGSSTNPLPPPLPVPSFAFETPKTSVVPPPVVRETIRIVTPPQEPAPVKSPPVVASVPPTTAPAPVASQTLPNTHEGGGAGNVSIPFVDPKANVVSVRKRDPAPAPVPEASVSVASVSTPYNYPTGVPAGKSYGYDENRSKSDSRDDQIYSTKTITPLATTTADPRVGRVLDPNFFDKVSFKQPPQPTASRHRQRVAPPARTSGSRKGEPDSHQ